MKKLITICLAACLLLTSACAFSENADFLSRISGSYVELFPVFRENSAYWTETVMELLSADQETAEATVEMLLSMCEATVYGPEAVEAYGDLSEGYAFDCYFHGGVKTFVTDGDRISGLDADGAEVFSHSYSYMGDVEYPDYPGMGFYFHVYRSNDEGSGDFTYFAFADDTPDETYHLEFRYAASDEGLYNWYSGPYAFWNAAAIPAGADESLVHACIDLFAYENLIGEEE